MAVDDAEGVSDQEPTSEESTDRSSSATGESATVGDYSWEDYIAEYEPSESAEELQMARQDAVDDAADRVVGLDGFFEAFCDPKTTPVVEGTWLWEHYKRQYYYQADGSLPRTDADEIIRFDSTAALGFELDAVDDAADRVVKLDDFFEEFCNPETTPVVKGTWMWEHYKRLYYYEADGSRPRTDEGEIIRFDQSEALGFAADALEPMLAGGADTADQLADLVDERTVDIQEDFDEDAFFQTDEGTTTIANRYDLEKAVPMDKKTHFVEVERYWVNKPYSFVIIFRSTKENETKYYAVEPYRNEIEAEMATYLTGKLRTAIKYGDQGASAADEEARREVIASQTYQLLSRYGLYDQSTGSSIGDLVAQTPPKFAAYTNALLDQFEGLLKRFEGPAEGIEAMFDGLDTGPKLDHNADGTRYGEYLDSRDRTTNRGPQRPLHERLIPDRLDPEAYRLDPEPDSELEAFLKSLGYEPPADDESTAHELAGIAARPEPAVIEENAETLTEYQVEKLLYYLQRDFIGYERIDPIKHDINVEDISCDGYNSPVFVYHSGYEQIISNIIHGESELDDFVVKLAQRSGKGISKRRPQVDATLPDGSRAQLTLGKEVSDHGTNYTIRQFKEVPFTPIDLINWKTFSLEEMAFLWLAIENDKSLIFAGGTASGKTTSLNAVSLFIPSNTKIVSIEDTREVELPQRNWIASVTRPSFTEGDKGDIDEFDLLEAALRQRPDYIVMGEIRGEEGRTLFQVMSTGHTTYTTFHADSVGEVLKRFTTQPISVSKTMFSALDLVSIQTSTRVRGKKVRRNKSLTEINHYDAENDEINVQDIYQWQAEDDEFLKMGTSNTLEEIKFDRGWTSDELHREMFERQLVLAYLIDRGLNTYTQVAATLQAYINDPETILGLMANDELETSLEDLREMESVLISVDPEVEKLVPRPDPGKEEQEIATAILESATELFDEYRGQDSGSVGEALEGMADVATSQSVDAEAAPFGGETALSEETSQLGENDTVAEESNEVESSNTREGQSPFDTYLDEGDDRTAIPSESESSTSDDLSTFDESKPSESQETDGGPKAVDEETLADAESELERPKDDPTADPSEIDGWDFPDSGSDSDSDVDSEETEDK
jgi:flagellar protein FlaI